MEKIGHLLGRGDYDLVLLEELWMRPDHETIKAALGPGLHMTEYDDLNKCQGTIWPWGCSGLAIISRYKIIATTPHPHHTITHHTTPHHNTPHHTRQHQTTRHTTPHNSHWFTISSSFFRSQILLSPCFIIS